jgi:hypothetical protein
LPRCWSRDGGTRSTAPRAEEEGDRDSWAGLGRRMLDSRTPLVWERMGMGQIVILGTAIRCYIHQFVEIISPVAWVRSGVRLLRLTWTHNAGRDRLVKRSVNYPARKDAELILFSSDKFHTE